MRSSPLASIAPESLPFSDRALGQSIPSRFEEQVRFYPQRLAVRSPIEAVTYEVLNAKANRIAWAVREDRDGEQEPVALFFDSGVDCIAAILGTLKAGKIYVALDPSAAPATTAQLIDDSGAQLILTDPVRESLAVECAAGGERRVLSVGRLGARPSENLDLAISPEALAYIYYTSGATGAPKGVVDSHRNVLHNVMRYTRSLRISPEDRLTLLQRPVFSGAVSNVFGALLNGASVFSWDPRVDGIHRIGAWLANGKITIYHSVPSLFGRAMEDSGELPALRFIRLEGDRCTLRHVEVFQQRFRNGSQLVNGLGSTETGIARQFFIRPDTRLETATVPVGYATADVQAAVLDESESEVAPGEAGEIVYSSPFLARGYWRRPELTAARFQDGAQGSRTFRSGDLGRMHPDGCLEHLGRKDSRLRVRGKFVRPEQVESELRRIPGVSDARVQTFDGADGIARIAAYVVPGGTGLPTVTAMRRRLRGQLPEHAIPSAYVSLPAFPLDENGKVDLRRLGPPGSGRPVLEPPYVAPRTPTEALLAGIWCEVLQVSRVGIHDDFFDLGGASLEAGMVISRLRRFVPGEILIRTVFEEPTIERLATAILREAPQGA